MFAQLTATAQPHKYSSERASAPLFKAIFPSLFANVLLGTIGGWMVLQLPNQSAIALETPSAQTLETFKISNVPNSILCIAACNEFFEAVQASFESEIQRLQSRVVRPEASAPLLQVDPSLLETSAEQREAESR